MRKFKGCSLRACRTGRWDVIFLGPSSIQLSILKLEQSLTAFKISQEIFPEEEIYLGEDIQCLRHRGR